MGKSKKKKAAKPKQGNQAGSTSNLEEWVSGPSDWSQWSQWSSSAFEHVDQNPPSNDNTKKTKPEEQQVISNNEPKIHSKLYICLDCDTSFGDSERLVEHRDRFDYICPLCNIRYNLLKYKNHIPEVHMSQHQAGWKGFLNPEPARLESGRKPLCMRDELGESSQGSSSKKRKTEAVIDLTEGDSGTDHDDEVFKVHKQSGRSQSERSMKNDGPHGSYKTKNQGGPNRNQHPQSGKGRGKGKGSSQGHQPQQPRGRSFGKFGPPPPISAGSILGEYVPSPKRPGLSSQQWPGKKVPSLMQLDLQKGGRKEKILS